MGTSYVCHNLTIFRRSLAGLSWRETLALAPGLHRIVLRLPKNEAARMLVAPIALQRTKPFTGLAARSSKVKNVKQAGTASRLSASTSGTGFAPFPACSTCPVQHNCVDARDLELGL